MFKLTFRAMRSGVNPRRKYFFLEQGNSSFRTLSRNARSVDEVMSKYLLPSKEHKTDPGIIILMICNI